jgi:hypothetical protein
MAYTTPVTDRAQSDIDTPTSKEYFNVSDWTRVHDNAKVTTALAEIETGAPIPFTTQAAPTVTTIPNVVNFNTLLTSIETMRLAVLADIPSLTTSIKDDWGEGVGVPVFNFEDVNLWEQTLDAAWVYYDGASLEVCPTLTADLTILTGASVVYVDCLNTDTYKVYLEGTAKLYII